MASGKIEANKTIDISNQLTNVRSGYSAKLFKNGKTYFLKISSASTALTGSGWVTLATLPQSALPADYYDFVALNNNASSSSGLPVQCRIASNGNVNAYIYNGTSNCNPLVATSWLTP